MTRAARSRPGRTPAGGDGCTVTVCRGCCCGRPEKNPAHEDQRPEIRR